jgi:hypothetical protein
MKVIHGRWPNPDTVSAKTLPILGIRAEIDELLDVILAGAGTDRTVGCGTAPTV